MHKNDDVAARNWDGFRVLLASSKAPGQCSGPESHDFSPDLWLDLCSNAMVNGDSMVPYCAVN